MRRKIYFFFPRTNHNAIIKIVKTSINGRIGIKTLQKESSKLFDVRSIVVSVLFIIIAKTDKNIPKSTATFAQYFCFNSSVNAVIFCSYNNSCDL